MPFAHVSVCDPPMLATPQRQRMLPMSAARTAMLLSPTSPDRSSHTHTTRCEPRERPPLSLHHAIRSTFHSSVLTAGPRTSQRRPGFGLGLSIVRAITHAQGGEVAAVARADGGLTVTVTVPH